MGIFLILFLLKKVLTQRSIDVFVNTESLYYELRVKLLNKASYLIDNIFDDFFRELTLFFVSFVLY